MPTPNENPGVSLIDRLQAENKKLKDDNAELQKSVSKLELFNKILEREIAELKTPENQPGPAPVYALPNEPSAPLPIKKIATYAAIGVLVLASIYAVASLFSGNRPTPVVQPTVAENTVVAPPVEKKPASLPPVLSTPTAKTKSSTALQDDTSRRRRALMEDHTPYDSIGASAYGLGRYKVLSRAYFHTKPNPDSKIELFINPLTKTSLEALDEKNGFVFVVFKNQVGKVTRGWLSKADLREVN